MPEQKKLYCETCDKIRGQFNTKGKGQDAFPVCKECDSELILVNPSEVKGIATDRKKYIEVEKIKLPDYRVNVENDLKRVFDYVDIIEIEEKRVLNIRLGNCSHLFLSDFREIERIVWDNEYRINSISFEIEHDNGNMNIEIISKRY